MNQKIFLIGIIIVVIILSLSVILQNFSNKTPNQLSLNSQDDLDKIIDKLSQEMYDKKIFMSIQDANRLSGVDPTVSVITLDKNQMSGTSSFSRKNPSSKHSGEFYSNGTRTYFEYSNNGTLLKSITIHDNPDKKILMIIK